jgi:hypothetical protein
MVPVRVHLLDTQTGLEAWYEYQIAIDRAEDPDDNEGFWWTDGNAACDCERGRCLYSALGKPDPQVPCGDSRIRIIEATVDGKSRKWCDSFDGKATQV